MKRESTHDAGKIWRALLLSLGCWSWVSPSTALAHGGTTVAEGRSGGMTVLVQGSDAGTRGVRSAVDLATTLNGPGTGPSAAVVYYVRPAGQPSVRVATERDESGVLHAEISTAGRGDWRQWAVSAIVTLAGGKRLRVANTPDNPPGPDPARATEHKATATTPAARHEPGELVAEQPVDDISGEEEQAPRWALPSLGGLVAAGLFGLAVTRRRRT